MESIEKPTASAELSDASGDEIAKEEPETAEQVAAEAPQSFEFSPNWRFYLAFSSLAVVTLAVCNLIFLECTSEF